jgi:3-hydroxyacyl-CoA dehydrogenase/enoyl-CoA hydratase/3-hydroxybutyryl-CoA epimerase/3-hydroxyacyl-CoA dehydrogenase/enoyl-CoA hydratase/3-hydroxybutyryl-CoA epimerase/enoyl-CoA isomerase
MTLDIKLGVLGGGIMGAGIAAAFRRKDVPVVVYDIAPGGREMVERNLLREEVSGGEFTDQLSDLSGCNVVIESVVEKIDVKQELLKAVEDVVTSDCLIGSNTSTIPISRLASVLQRPDRFCGIHFLHPVRNRKLTEIVCGDQAAPATLDQADAVLKSVDQTPLWVKDCPGFVVNRLLQPYLNEALILLQEGVDMDRIDNAAVNFGMAWGPVKTMDEIGIDTTFNAGRVLYDAFPDRITVSPIIVSLYKSKCWGVKSGQGFRIWDGCEAARASGGGYVSETAGFGATHFQSGTDLVGCDPNPKAQKWKMWVEQDNNPMPEKEIVERLIRPMWEEGRRILADGIVESAEKIRIAACDGLAFPAKYGYLFEQPDFQLN